jgi:hypothetical protein
MSIITNWRIKAGNYFLNKMQALVQRKKHFESFDKAKTVGIIFNATDKEEFELVKRYVRYLKECNKKVKSIGFFNTDKIPDLTYSKLEWDFFTVKDLAWNYIPNKSFIENFINEEFDILIDMNIHHNFPLHYISCLSKAHFKIGLYNPNSDYDLMIDMPEEKGLKFFLRNVDQYIQLLKSNKNATA